MKRFCPYVQSQGWRGVPFDCAQSPSSWHSQAGLVSERCIPDKPHYGSLGIVIPFPCKKHGKESVRRHGLWSSAGKKMCQKEPNLESLLSDFRVFSSFRELRNAANGIFYSSQYWENRFSPISCFPNVGKADFQRFLIFPRGGKPLFAVFYQLHPVSE